MQQRNLLLISYLFPPAGGVTVQRAISLARYLPAQGFKVHVLRASNAPSPVVDNSLLQRDHPDVTMHGAFTPELPFEFRHTIWRLLGSGKADASSAKGLRNMANARGPKNWGRGAIRRLI